MGSNNPIIPYDPNADLIAQRFPTTDRHGELSKNKRRRYGNALWEDINVADLTPYQLGASFAVTNCISILVQVSFLVNPMILNVRDGAVGPNSYALALTAPKGIEITNGEAILFESDQDPVTGNYYYLEPKNFWIMSLLSAGLAGGRVHIVYGVLS